MQSLKRRPTRHCRRDLVSIPESLRCSASRGGVGKMNRGSALVAVVWGGVGHAPSSRHWGSEGFTSHQQTMTIRIVCRCGKQLRALDDLAEKRVKCPSCGQVSPVPACALPYKGLALAYAVGVPTIAAVSALLSFVLPGAIGPLCHDVSLISGISLLLWAATSIPWWPINGFFWGFVLVGLGHAAYAGFKTRRR